MKLAILAITCSITLGGYALAESADKPNPTPPTTKKARPINKKCPVTGDDVDTQITWEYKGKIIGFCCKDCIEPFQKDLEKYMKDLK